MAKAVWIGGPQDGTEIVLPYREEGYDDLTTVEKFDNRPYRFGSAPIRPRKPNYTSSAPYGIHWNERLK